MGVDLYWIPLGAGTSVVRLNGKVYEACCALLRWRRPRDLYHSALIATVCGERFTIEMTPVPPGAGDGRGVVAGGSVGAQPLGRFRLFRYELRCWRNGTIPDEVYAIGGPVRVTDDASKARAIVDLMPRVPTPVWGRDALETGEMWNSNSVVSWLLATAGLDMASIQPPKAGRAPGWGAGLVVAARVPPGRP
jgi:hypothetical protein